NSRSQRKAAAESVPAKYALLKQLMGYPPAQPLTLSFAPGGVAEAIRVDTLPEAPYAGRVEYRLLQSAMQLQTLEVQYNRMGYLPSVSAFLNYNFTYQNNAFRDLYGRNFPNSAAGLKVSLPLFAGTRRLQHLQQARLQRERLQLAATDLEARINAQYRQALAVYRSNLNEWNTQAENLELAREVYNTVKMQYDEGVKTYLEVITAETDLRTAQLTYLDALYNLLASKLDVQQAMGTVPLP
ncbi:MAG TPA: TolC family protein, partial [Cytophagales bacterium]